MQRALASFLVAFLFLLALHVTFHAVLLCLADLVCALLSSLSDAFHASTTSVWRVGTLYPVLLKLATSATTVVMLARGCRYLSSHEFNE